MIRTMTNLAMIDTTTSLNTHYDSVIVGLGKTGLSVAKYLHDHHKTFAITDSRCEPPELKSVQTLLPNVPIYNGEIDQQLLLQTDEVVLSPGVPKTHPAVMAARQQGVAIVNDIELFCRHVRAPIIAITGTNGKSTVTTLVAELLKLSAMKVKVGGNIGYPALSLLTDDQDVDIYVLELSSFQLELLQSLNAHAAVVLNISPDHLDRYDNEEAYSKAKQRIYQGDGLMVINMDDDKVKQMYDHKRHTIGFTLHEPKDNEFGLVVNQQGQTMFAQGSKTLINVNEVAICGQHNQANVLATMALLSGLDMQMELLLSGLKQFKGLPHRCQLVAKENGVTWINDSKATNVSACIAAINSYQSLGRIVLIAGGDAKNAPLEGLSAILKQYVFKVILLGQDADKLMAVIPAGIDYDEVEDMTAAVVLADRYAQSGDIVLLSPACASIDMYVDYQARGDAFTHAVCAGLER